MRGGDKFRRRLADLAAAAADGRGAKVRVGIFESAKYADGLPVAAAAFWNEYGTVSIPPRPFFRNTIAAHRHEWPQQAAAILRQNGDVRQTLALMGEGIKGQIAESIQNLHEPANAPATVRKKGFDKPLIDTGTLWRSIGSEIVEE